MAMDKVYILSCFSFLILHIHGQVLMNSLFGPTKDYEIVVKTSSAYARAAGSRNWIFIEIFGDQGKSTGSFPLNNWFQQDFGKGGKNIFKFRAPFVGIPSVIRLEIRFSIGEDPWALDYVHVKYDISDIYFPVYEWVTGKGMTIEHGQASLAPQVSNNEVSTLLSGEFKKMQSALPWISDPKPGDLAYVLPKYLKVDSVANFPLVFWPTETRAAGMLRNFLRAKVNDGLQILKNQLFQLTDLDSYSKLYTILDYGSQPEFLSRWQSDIEFGWQQMNGVTPLSFEILKARPTDIPLEVAEYNKVLGVKDVDAEIAAGKLFIADYSQVFQKIKRNKNSLGEQLYCPDAIAIYHVDDKGNMAPIIIQLVPNDNNYTFTSLDSASDWLLAKMYFRVAQGNMHQWYYHFLMTHDVIEPFATGLFRNFHPSHPLYKLLKPHLQTIPAVNELGRSQLLPAKSAANTFAALDSAELTVKMYSSFTMEDLYVTDILTTKGLTDKNILSQFYYRDDVSNLWKIIGSFVTNVIQEFYKTDNDVASDQYLQNFVKDVALSSLDWQNKNVGSQNVKGIPIPMKTPADVLKLCLPIIFTSSVQHAVANYPQFEFYKFIPNSPLAMRLPPHKKKEATIERIMNSLPNIEMSVETIEFTYILSQYMTDEVFIGNYPEKLFVEPNVLAHLESYKKQLDDYASGVNSRNQDLKASNGIPYDLLLPNRIPNSIAI